MLDDRGQVLAEAQVHFLLCGGEEGFDGTAYDSRIVLGSLCGRYKV